MKIEESIAELEDCVIKSLLFRNNDSDEFILAVHGWLDNANSFELLARSLNVNILAIDLPGHADSYFKAEKGQFHYVFYLSVLYEYLQKICKDKPISLMGHSLGAGISSLFAGIFPEKVTDLILLDGIGAFSVDDHTIHLQLKHYIKEYSKIYSKKIPRYEDPMVARAAKKLACKLDDCSIDAIMQRALKKSSDGSYIWNNDKRLMLPSAQMLNEAQVISILKNISSRTLLVLPEDGYPYPADSMQDRIKSVANLKLEYVEGNHHAHLDHSAKVATIINSFLTNDI